jgi:hypothetical protein
VRFDAGKVLAGQSESDDTQVPIPRSLSNTREVRREMVHLYKQTKRYQIDPALSGRLISILNSIAALDGGTLLVERVAVLEEHLANGKANGHARSEAP